MVYSLKSLYDVKGTKGDDLACKPVGMFFVDHIERNRDVGHRPEPPPAGNRNGNERLLGVVEGGRLLALDPAIPGLRFTTIQRQEARSVDSGELDLTAHEGAAIMVEGVGNGGWLYEARIIDHGRPILTAVVREAFRNHP